MDDYAKYIWEKRIKPKLLVGLVIVVVALVWEGVEFFLRFV